MISVQEEQRAQIGRIETAHARTGAIGVGAELNTVKIVERMALRMVQQLDGALRPYMGGIRRQAQAIGLGGGGASGGGGSSRASLQQQFEGGSQQSFLFPSPRPSNSSSSSGSADPGGDRERPLRTGALEPERAMVAALRELERMEQERIAHNEGMRAQGGQEIERVAPYEQMLAEMRRSGYGPPQPEGAGSNQAMAARRLRKAQDKEEDKRGDHLTHLARDLTTGQPIARADRTALRANATIPPIAVNNSDNQQEADLQAPMPSFGGTQEQIQPRPTQSMREQIPARSTSTPPRRDQGRGGQQK